MIRKFFTAGNYPQEISLALLILRIAAGLFMLTHGLQKMGLLFGAEPIQFADPIGIGQTPTLVLAVFTEGVCALCLILGFATRFAAAMLLSTMTVAILIIHSGDEFKVIELALLYSSAYLAIIIAGAGRYSLDSMLFRNPDPSAV